MGLIPSSSLVFGSGMEGEESGIVCLDTAYSYTKKLS